MSRITWKADLRGPLVGHARDVAADALTDALEFLLETANRTVPLEEGTLQRSGSVVVDRSALTGAVSYDTAYARRQHEEMTWRHDPGRRAKWLELTFLEEGVSVGDFLAERIRAAL